MLCLLIKTNLVTFIAYYFVPHEFKSLEIFKGILNRSTVEIHIYSIVNFGFLDLFAADNFVCEIFFNLNSCKCLPYKIDAMCFISESRDTRTPAKIGHVTGHKCTRFVTYGLYLIIKQKTLARL